MIQYLQDGGYPKEYLVALTLVPNDGSNSRAAKEFIAPAVESVLKQAQTVAQQAGFKGKVPQKVDFVAHSMGAVSSRWYATQMRPERVRTWISVAGANYGSKSICPYPSDGNNEICTTFKTSLQIDLLRKLNGTASQPTDPTPYGLGQDKAGIPRVPPTSSRSIFYLTIRIDPDPWITPAENAMIEGAGGLPLKLPTELPFKETSPGNYLLTENGDHDGLPQHPEVLRLVEIMLAARN
jgi:pimeloyl-ACP methyl ester carboxylesterase